MAIKENTNIFGLLGRNISYSFSRGYFLNKFKELGFSNYDYLNFDLHECSEFLEIIKLHKNLKGLNVTIPFKQEIMPFLDEIDSTAAKIGAVNTIHFTKDGKLKGFNSDVVGFEKSFTPWLHKHHQKALILGTGGASKAVAFVLKKNHISYQFVSRNPQHKNEISYHSLTPELIESHHIIVNCSPLGTSPNVDKFPDIPYQFINKNHLLYDLIYNPEETVFLSKGKKQGAVIKNGYEMLVLQAEESWRIWHKE